MTYISEAELARLKVVDPDLPKIIELSNRLGITVDAARKLTYADLDNLSKTIEGAK